MRRIIFFTLFTVLTISLFSEEALSIVRKLDSNEIYESIKYEGEMIIETSGKKYVKTFYAYGQGSKQSFMEFTNSDDAGTKYLKTDGKLFIYSPDSEEVIPITGHMLKESMMGSDMSYEDTIDNDTLEARYNSKILREEDFNGKSCYVLELVAKKKTESYPKQVIWVDKENYNGLKAELYALSGAKLKEQQVLEIKKIGKRFFPILIEVKDLLRKNSKTTFKMNGVELDTEIPRNTFSLKNLER
ncbi:MAG TPA: outer membrane lipoprotein-sorting protein [Spirochaetota bacterium]|nr:outer membrane lipoprotein-sorting protein [Spirochaetota bacterium]